MTTQTATAQDKKLLPWTIWFIAALFYLYEYFVQVSPNVMSQELMKAFHISGTQLGYLGGIYFISYAIMQIPVGLILDSWGPRKALTLATSVFMVACLIFGLTNSFHQILFARFLIGFGSAFAAVSCLKIVTNWFPLKRFAVMSGLTLAMGTLGGVIGQAPLALLVAKINWRPTMIFLSALAALLIVCVVRFVKDAPENKTTPTAPKEAFTLKGVLNVIHKKQNWLIASYGGLIYMPTTILGTLWGATFISAEYNLTQAVAAGYISLLFIGWLVGSPLFGYFSDHIGKRKPPLYIASIGAFICLIAIIYLHPPVFLLGTLFFFLGFLSSGFFPSFTIILEINARKENATALGFMNTFNMVGPVLVQPLVGHILDLHWSGQLADGVHVYSVANYHIALAILPICVLLSLVLLPFIRETYCRSDK